MRQDIYFKSVENLPISVTLHGLDKTPWTTVKFGDFQNQITLYLEVEQLRELVSKIDAELRPAPVLCDAYECENEATCKVTVDKGQNVGYFLLNLCTECAVTAVRSARADAEVVHVTVEPVTV